jgi:putative ABC transport system permease protein
MRFYKYNQIFTGINLIGLSIALSISFIILLFVINELSYDHCHKNRKRIFRVLNHYTEFNKTDSQTPYILATALKEEFSQIEKSIRVSSMHGFKLKLKDEYINISDAIATDSEVFDIFTLPLIAGVSNHNLLEDKNSLVLSRQLATTLFPNQDPLGKEIMGLINNKENVFIVKGVFENIPENSTFISQCFVNSSWTVTDINNSGNKINTEKNWRRNFWSTWVLLSKDCNAKSLEHQFRAFEIKNISEKPDNQYSLQNLSDVYLGSEHVTNSRISGNISNVRLFSAIAFLIVLVAAINYIILSTAVSAGRAKEIGIRKTYGAGNVQIKSQLFCESILLAILVLPVALILMKLALPFAGKLFQTQLNIISTNIIVYISVYLILTIFIGAASGIYTSAYLSRLKVFDILKYRTHMGKRKHFFRSFLIIIQLIIFCTFVSSILIIRSQYQYALKKNLGYYNSDILFINLGHGFEGYSAFVNSIKSNPNVIMASGVMDGLPMSGEMTFMIPHFQDKKVGIQVERLEVDYSFLKTMGITLLQGRDFSEDFGSDLTQSAILNETAVKKLGITDPLGQKIGDRTIIGLVKDFNLHSIHSNISPLEINLTDKYINQVAVHYKSGTLNSILPMLKTEWEKSAHDRVFRFSTIEDLIKENYSAEKNLATIVSIFALFTLFIAAFGLFGLTLFISRSRTKEIGIKKVFGCSEKSIIYSFQRGNFTLVLLATLLSVPVTLYFMMRWLSNFAYKVSINCWLFAITFTIAFLVVLLTISFHSYKASRINPVNALRYD